MSHAHCALVLGHPAHVERPEPFGQPGWIRAPSLVLVPHSQTGRTEVQGIWRQQEDLRSLGRVMGILEGRGDFRGTLRDL